MYIMVCVLVRVLYLHICVYVDVCVLEEGEGDFIINQGPSLSVRAAHTPWLND